MTPINDLFETHSLYSIQKPLIKQQVLERFGRLLNERLFNDWYLSLRKFCQTDTLMYHNPDTLDQLLNLFSRNTERTISTLIQHQREISRATFSILRSPANQLQEDLISLDEPDDILNFERIWHPEYQRYCENIFNHLSLIPFSILSTNKNKDNIRTSLRQRAKFLKENDCGYLTVGYDPLIRNSISHGSIEYEMRTIKYFDLHDQKELSPSNFSQILDDLIDNCHSYLIAIIIFICENKETISPQMLSKIPLGIRFLLISALSNHHGLTVSSMVESSTIDNRKQLNISCKIDSSSRTVHIFESLFTARNALNIGGNDYDRIGVSIHCGKPVFAALFIDANIYKHAIKENLPIEEIQDGLIESPPMLWFNTSSLGNKLYFWKNFYKYARLKLKNDFLNELRNNGQHIVSSRYTLKHIENKSAGSNRRIEVLITLNGDDEISFTDLLDIVKHSLKKLKKHKIKGLDLDGESFFKRRPVYIWLKVYQENKRVRQLKRDGWDSGNLILIAEWFTNRSKNKSIIVKNPDLIVSDIRIQLHPDLRELAAKLNL